MFLRLVVTFFLCLPTTQAKKMHGISLSGPLKYEKNFSHFDYVNPNAPKGGTFAMAVIGSYDTLNPFTIKGTPAAGLVFLYSSPTFATLVQRSHDEHFSSYGYVAESFEVANDKKSITFYMRKEAKFHDGSPIQAEDVVYTFYQLREKGLPLFRQYYNDIIKASVIDSHTVRFDFKDDKNKELKSIIGDMPILSKKFLQAYPLEEIVLTPMLGSGPYKIESFDPGRHIIYKRVEDWWGEKVPGFKGRNNFDKMEYVYYHDPEVAFQGLKTGEIDFHIETRAARWAEQYNFPAIKKGYVIKDEYHHEMTQPMTGLAFNLRRKKFADKRVRQAITLALDFEWANKNLFHDMYKRVNTYFANSDLGSTGKPTGKVLKILEHYRDKLPEELFTTDYQLPVNDGSGNIRALLQRSYQLLQEAGYVIKNFKLVDAETGEPFTLEILLGSNTFDRILQSFIQNLEILGIKANLRVVDQAQYLRRTQDYDFDMIVHQVWQSSSPGNEQREMWSSHVADQPGTKNVFGIKDPLIDELIEKIIDSPDRESLIAYCQALDLVLLHGWYIIPFWYDDTYKLAYWVYLKRPEKMPPYHLPMDIFWLDRDKQEEIKLQKG